MIQEVLSMTLTPASIDVAMTPAAFSESVWARDEDWAATTGRPVYATDKVRPAQAFARIVRSTVAHGRIVSIDTAEAAAQTGVLGAYTAADVKQREGGVPTIPIRIRARPELDAYAQPVLASDKVRYVGEPVAVVVAESEALAEDAADLVSVVYDPLPVLLDVDVTDTTSTLAQELFPHTENCLATYNADTGGVDEAFEAADVVITQKFRVGRDTSMPLEPRALLAEWDVDLHRLYLWGPAKFLKFTRDTIADWFKIGADDVICRHIRVGGMFGTRGELYPEEFLVPWAARETGRPVKWVEDRAEHMMSINQSRDTVHRVSVAATSDGRLLALDAQMVVNLGAYPRPIGTRVAEILAEGAPGPYIWPCYRGVCRAMVSNKTPAGTMRGPGTFDLTFARERILDILAGKLNMSPIELRRRNLIPRQLMPYTQPLGPRMHPVHYDSGDFVGDFDHFLATVDLPALDDSVQARRAAGEDVGIGVACFLDHSGLGKKESVRLDALANGRFRFSTAGTEIGQGLGSVVARIGSEALGVSIERVDVVTNDSSEFIEGAGTFSSRSTIFVGSAAHHAAHQLHRKRPDLFDGDVAWAPRSNGPAGQDAPADIVETVIGTHEQAEPTYGFGTHLAVVSVDPGTFALTVERLCVAYDCGRAIDRESVRTQLEGGAIFGLGGALYQQINYDPQGQPQSTTLLDFNVPMAAEVPDVETVIFEHPGVVSNPLAVKGVGEAGVMGVGGAIANAAAAAIHRPGSITMLPLAANAEFADGLVDRYEARLERAGAMSAGTPGPSESSQPRSSSVAAHIAWRPILLVAALLGALAWAVRRYRRKVH